MQGLRASLRLLSFTVVLVATTATPAWAQTASPSPGGLCAPWHRCVAGGLMLMVIGFVALAGLGYLIQAKGFSKVEHRQGSPDGVPAGKP